MFTANGRESRRKRPIRNVRPSLPRSRQYTSVPCMRHTGASLRPYQAISQHDPQRIQCGAAVLPLYFNSQYSLGIGCLVWDTSLKADGVQSFPVERQSSGKLVRDSLVNKPGDAYRTRLRRWKSISAVERNYGPHPRTRSMTPIPVVFRAALGFSPAGNAFGRTSERSRAISSRPNSPLR